MIPNRIAPHAQRNPQLIACARTPGEGNHAWLERMRRQLKGHCNHESAIVLLGGNSVTHFRARVAQSQTRHDLKPSFWSHVMLMTPGDSTPNSTPELWQVALAEVQQGDTWLEHNGINKAPASTFDDPQHYPNAAYIALPGACSKDLSAALDHVRQSRLEHDLIAPCVAWLGYLWGVKDYHNPLTQGIAFPAALFVEAVLTQTGFDVSPGMAERSVCPEAIWQGALWWRDYYQVNLAPGDDTEETTDALCPPPQGAYVLDQPAAAVIDHDKNDA